MFVDQKTGFRVLKEIVAERPDHVDPNSYDAEATCQYARREGEVLEPVCLIGVWIDRVSPNLERVESCSDTANGALNTADVQSTDVMVALLEAAQSYQDGAAPWSVALEGGLGCVADALRERNRRAKIPEMFARDLHHLATDARIERAHS